MRIRCKYWSSSSKHEEAGLRICVRWCRLYSLSLLYPCCPVACTMMSLCNDGPAVVCRWRRQCFASFVPLLPLSLVISLRCLFRRSCLISSTKGNQQNGPKSYWRTPIERNNFWFNSTYLKSIYQCFYDIEAWTLKFFVHSFIQKELRLSRLDVSHC